MLLLPLGLDRFSIIEITPGPIDCKVRLVVLPLRDPALEPDLEFPPDPNPEPDDEIGGPADNWFGLVLRTFSWRTVVAVEATESA